MTEHPSPEVNCPTCGKSFSPHLRARERVLCGPEKTPLAGKDFNPSDCKLYYICSPECAERLDKEQGTEPQKSRIKEFLERIGDASTRCGVDENDVCNLIKRIYGRGDYLK